MALAMVSFASFPGFESRQVPEFIVGALPDALLGPDTKVVVAGFPGG
jgi:hypothetical protein